MHTRSLDTPAHACVPPCTHMCSHAPLAREQTYLGPWHALPPPGTGYTQHTCSHRGRHTSLWDTQAHPAYLLLPLCVHTFLFSLHLSVRADLRAQLCNYPSLLPCLFLTHTSESFSRTPFARGPIKVLYKYKFIPLSTLGGGYYYWPILQMRKLRCRAVGSLAQDSSPGSWS